MKRFFPDAGTCAPCPSLEDFQKLIAPLIAFFLGLVGIGAVTLAFAVCALRRKDRGKGRKWSQTIGEGVVVVTQLLLWVWNSTQGVASLFTQAQVLAPSYLAPIYSISSSLQFKGFTLSPSCYTTPFGDFWAVFYAVLGLLLGSVVSFLFYPHGYSSSAEMASLTGNGERLAVFFLPFCFLALSLGYGPITSRIVNALTCLPPSPLTIADYVGAAGDGTTLSSVPFTPTPALPTRPSFEDVLTAVANPKFASDNKLTAYLRTNVPVSLLANGAIQVCYEGPHRPVYRAAIALIPLFILGVPFAFLWALHSSKLLTPCWWCSSCRGRRTPPVLSSTQSVNPLQQQRLEQVSKRNLNDQSEPALPPYSASTVILASMGDSHLQRRFFWAEVMQKLLVAVFAGCTGISVNAKTLGLFVASQVFCVFGALLGAIILLYMKPYQALWYWKAIVGAMLYATIAATAIINILLQVRGVAWAKESSRGAILSIIPVVFAVTTLLALFIFWWPSLLKHALIKKLITPPPPPPIKIDIVDGVVGVSINPMFHHQPNWVTPSSSQAHGGEASYPVAAAAQATSTLFSRIETPQGPMWYNQALKSPFKELPPGSTTTCGWHYDPGSPLPWYNSMSGERACNVEEVASSYATSHAPLPFHDFPPPKEENLEEDEVDSGKDEDFEDDPWYLLPFLIEFDPKRPLSPPSSFIPPKTFSEQALASFAFLERQEARKKGKKVLVQDREGPFLGKESPEEVYALDLGFENETGPPLTEVSTLDASLPPPPPSFTDTVVDPPTIATHVPLPRAAQVPTHKTFAEEAQASFAFLESTKKAKKARKNRGLHGGESVSEIQEVAKESPVEALDLGFENETGPPLTEVSTLDVSLPPLPPLPPSSFTDTVVDPPAIATHVPLPRAAQVPTHKTFAEEAQASFAIMERLEARKKRGEKKISFVPLQGRM